DRARTAHRGGLPPRSPRALSPGAVMSRAVVFTEYGSPDVLRVIDVAPTEPGPGQVRIAVRAAGIQPFDALFRSGATHPWVPARFPQRIGNELSGIVEAAGAGARFPVGTEVLGWVTLAAAAEQAIALDSDLVIKPARMSWAEAGSLSASGQTASTAIDRLDV